MLCFVFKYLAGSSFTLSYLLLCVVVVVSVAADVVVVVSVGSKQRFQRSGLLVVSRLRWPVLWRERLPARRNGVSLSPENASKLKEKAGAFTDANMGMVCVTSGLKD